MRELELERRGYREVTNESLGVGLSAGFAPGRTRVFVRKDLDPGFLLKLLEAPIDRTDWTPLQPDPPAPPILRYWVNGLDDLVHDPSDPRYPLSPDTPPGP